MYRLIESIKLFDGHFHNLSYHELRINLSLKELFGRNQAFGLESLLERIERPGKGLFKCRLLYNNSEYKIEFVPYVFKPIQSLKLVEDNHVSYAHKFLDRKSLENLLKLREGCDDVLIVKNDLVTDTSYANIVFRKEDEWVTPSSVLLAGTMRQFLLDKKVIQLRQIRKEDILSFESYRIINAMLGFESPEQDISTIIIS